MCASEGTELCYTVFLRTRKSSRLGYRLGHFLRKNLILSVINQRILKIRNKKPQEYFLNIILKEKLENIRKFSYLYLCTFIKTGLIFDAFCLQSQDTMPFLKYFQQFHTPKTLSLHAVQWEGRFGFLTDQNLLKCFILNSYHTHALLFVSIPSKKTFFMQI